MSAQGEWGYPRPLLRRANWQCLNGPWDFSFDIEGTRTEPESVDWTRSIEVPFAPETPASGIEFTGFFRACWYRRGLDFPEIDASRQAILHFEAVDYIASVWVNNELVARHEGGYTPFSVVLGSEYSGTKVEVIVRAEDDPADLAKPRGKQEWQLHPHGIWYPRTSGIWQTVWLEVVPATRIGVIQWTPNVERWEFGFETKLEGKKIEGARLELELTEGPSLLARDCYEVVAGEVHRRIALSDPGIDDYRNELLWTPATPTLVQASVKLRSKDGELLDEVESYTALRSLAIQGDRLVLNGRPYPLIMVLDQGYWPRSGMTATDGELKRDVELAKAMGFNGVRKHQKIEASRYLYWADTLGLMVWEEMPSAYRFTQDSIERLTREWPAIICRDRSHPCIVAWVPFNESWGVPDLPDSPAQRHYVQAIYHLTKTLDPSRPVVGNDGWESVATDIIGIHDYDGDPARMAIRYGLPGERLFQRERPGGRQLLIGQKHEGQPIMLTEFGGIAYSADRENTWGYTRSSNEGELEGRYRLLLDAVRNATMLAGFCYTQFADTYQEANGLLYADRSPKFPLHQVALANRGPRSQKDLRSEMQWREELMASQRELGSAEDRIPRTEPPP